MHLTRTNERRTPTWSESLLLATLLLAAVATTVPVGPAVRSTPLAAYSERASSCATPCERDRMPGRPDARISAMWRP